jgi:hypothetical protein
MAFRVDETGHGSTRVRRIRFGIMLFPGQVRRRANQRQPDDPPVTRAQLVSAHTRMIFQAASIWQSFVIEESDYTIEYSFTIDLGISENATPVRAGSLDSGSWAEDGSDPEHTRTHRSARDEALRNDFGNIAVVHPHFHAFGAEACAPALDTHGGITQPTPSTRHPGLQTRASDVIWIGLNGMSPDDPTVSQTAAHEMGHLLGLASRGPDGGIVGRRLRAAPGQYVRRFLSDRDKELVHLAVETRVPGSSVAMHALQLPTPPATSRRSARVRRGG